jgi:predicted aspartyl protease
MLAVLVVFCLSLLAADRITCPECGFENDPADRYSLNCASEIRALSEDDRNRKAAVREKKVRDAQENARRYFKKARRTRDLKRAVSLYQRAFRHALNAVSLGKEILNPMEIREMQELGERAKEQSGRLRPRARLGKGRIPLEKRGDAYYVRTLLNGNVEALLHFDTGCSTLLLSPEVAAACGETGGRKAVSVVADGRKVKSRMFRLDSVEISGYRIENVIAVSHETAGDGLLGMSFLKHFNFRIDPDAGELILEPKR